MERYFYEGCYEPVMAEQLKANPVFPLVRELNFKYHLKVLTVDTLRYYLVNNLGMAVCSVWTDKDDEERIQYNYRSPYFMKERGHSREDRETLRSVKISSLMATLKRHSVVPHDLMGRKAEIASHATNELRKALGDSGKSLGLTTNAVHALLAYYLGETTNKNLVDLDLDKCKIELDKMNKCDEIAELKTQEVNRFFAQGYYQFGVDQYGHLIVGKFKAINIDHKQRSMNVACVEPFKRYINPAECTDLAPLLTMIKLAYENNQGSEKTKLGIPVYDGYDQALDVVFYYQDRPTRYDCMWVFTPIGGVL